MGRGSGTWEARTRGRRDVGRGDPGTRGRRDGRKDVINKQHLNFALNLQFTIFVGQEKGIGELKIQTFSGRRRRDNPGRLGQRLLFSCHS